MSDAPVRPAPIVSPDWVTPPFGAERPIHPQHDHAYVWQVLYEDGTSLWEVAGGQHHVAADIDPSRAVGVRLLPMQPGYTGHAVQLRRTAPLADGGAPPADGRRPYVRRTTSWSVPALGPDGPVGEAVRLDWHVIGWERPDGTGTYLYVAPNGDAFVADAPNEV
jgi:hypothetical protein